jgi:hypothetical protein
MTNDENDRETGARHYPAKTGADARQGISQEAAKNRKPPGTFGLYEPANETNEKTRHSDGQQPSREDPAEGSRARAAFDSDRAKR